MMRPLTPLNLRPRLFVLGAVLALALIGCADKPRYTEPPLGEGNVVIDITALPLDHPQFYTYVFEGKNIDFFVIRLKSGVVSFFGACVTCYRQKRGYAEEDGHMVCRACGTRYSIYKLAEGIGGCYPVGIKGSLEAGRYRIPIASITSGAAMF